MKLLKTTSGLMGGGGGGGSTDGLFADFLYVHSFHSRTFMHSLTHSLIHPHPRLGLGNGAELLKISHRIVVYTGRWCDPAVI
jgi:hypothetical protein